LIGGLAYEHLLIPENYRFAPVSAGTETHSYLLPKAGVIWTPLKNTALRGAYSESVSGASFEQSYQLEPSQVAGFNQAFRSMIPESVSGANAGARFTSYGVSLEHKFPTRTYATLAGEWLESTVKRKLGAFETIGLATPFITTLAERLDFREQSASVGLHQLVGTEWTFGSAYRISRAELKDDYTGISDTAAANTGFPARQELTGTMHRLELSSSYQHSSGWFSQLRGVWIVQSNDGYQEARPGENFWQWDWLVGYRLPRRRAEIVVGVLNLTGNDYHLSPINLHAEIPREATFTARLRFHF
jgi:outer membrane receptor protein involved in Fe transport